MPDQNTRTSVIWYGLWIYLPTLQKFNISCITLFDYVGRGISIEQGEKSCWFSYQIIHWNFKW